MPELSQSMAEPYCNVWLIWAAAFLPVWTRLYALFPHQRRAMRWASLYTTAFGLARPLFVPAYRNPSGLDVPVEELGFGLAFGAYWAGVYEHICWQRVAAPPGAGPVARVSWP